MTTRLAAVIVAVVIGSAVADEIRTDLEIPEPEISEWLPAGDGLGEVVEDSYLPAVPLPRSHGAEPHWTTETVFDVLFLERDNGTDGQPVVLRGPAGPDPESTVLTTRDPVFATAPGVRLFHRRRDCDGDGWELGYWGVFGLFGGRRAELADGLAIPGELGLAVPGWQTADSIEAGYSSGLNVIELNLFASERWCTTTCNPRDPSHQVHRTTTLDWIGGLFWAGVDETAFLRVTVAPGEPSSAYSVATRSNLFGAQVGVRGRRQWGLWAVEGFWKLGLGGSWLHQSTDPITSTLVPDFEYRPRRTAATTNTGFLSSMNVTAIRPIGEHWSLRAGYNLAWLSGLALAPNQFDFTDTLTSGTGIEGAGSMFLAGASLGLERRW